MISKLAPEEMLGSWTLEKDEYGLFSMNGLRSFLCRIPPPVATSALDHTEANHRRNNSHHTR